MKSKYIKFEIHMDPEQDSDICISEKEIKKHIKKVFEDGHPNSWIGPGMEQKVKSMYLTIKRDNNSKLIGIIGIDFLDHIKKRDLGIGENFDYFIACASACQSLNDDLEKEPIPGINCFCEVLY